MQIYKCMNCTIFHDNNLPSEVIRINDTSAGVPINAPVAPAVIPDIHANRRHMTTAITKTTWAAWLHALHPFTLFPGTCTCAWPIHETIGT